MPKDVKCANQRKPGRRNRRQCILKDTGKASTTQEDQHKGTKERHPVSRLAPEDQRAQCAAHQDRDGIQRDLIGCQEAEREAKLMQQLPIVGGQLEGEALRAWLTVGLQDGIVPGNHGHIKRQDEQCQHHPTHTSDEQPAPMQARLRLVARTEVFNGACWALLQVHRCSW